jgi:hypothetical protein
MKHPALRSLLQAVAIVPVAALALPGCASSHAAVSRLRPLAPEVRAALGPAVGVVTPAQPATVAHDPGSNRVGTAGEGAVQGLQFMARGAAGAEQGAIVAVALLPVAAVGAIVESSRELPAAEVRRAEADLASGLHAVARQHALRDAFLHAARTADRRDYFAAEPAARACPWRIEIGVTDLQLRRTAPAGDDYTLTIQTRVRLVRAGDDQPVYDETVTFRSGAALFHVWAANRAQPLRQVADTGYRMIADEILAGLTPHSS